MYYLQSRYYDPAIGRFINADSYTSTDADNFLGCNMFAYCENSPITRTDDSGSLSVPFWFVAITLHDVYQILRKDEDRVFITGQDKNVTIHNSYSIKTPWVRYGYSIYANYFSPYKDTIKGTSEGVAFEWLAHNAAYNVFLICKALGVDMQGNISRAKDVDVGETIYDDDHGFFSTIMKGAYAFIRFPYAAVDLVVYSIKNNSSSSNKRGNQSTQKGKNTWRIDRMENRL